jgi:hypothetical protein
LHAYPLFRPWLFDDDFSILTQSYSCSAVRDNLWVPANEHAMPLGRLTTRLLVWLAGRPTALPLAAAVQGPLAAALGMWLVYLFVKRELGHCFYGLVAMIAFGVSLKYNEAVAWFAASFAVLALDTTLLALLAAQRWRRTGSRSALLLCTLWAALAPAWFASGILAGPFCCLYLLPLSGERRQAKGERERQSCGLRLLSFAPSLVPLLGSAAFLAVSLPQTAGRILNTGHYHERNALQAFDPVAGLVLSARTVVDSLVFGVANALGTASPPYLVVLGLGLLAVAGGWWWRRAPQPRLLLLGLGFIFLSYWLIYSTRAAWPYEGFMQRWTRYHLFPYLGLVLFLCGGLPSRHGTLFRLDPTGRLTRPQLRALALLIAVLFVAQFPQGVAGHLKLDRDPLVQWQVLQRIEEVDACCREHGISAETARQALEPLDVPYSGEPPRINGWEWLRGSARAQPMSIAEAKRLLTP